RRRGGGQAVRAVCVEQAQRHGHWPVDLPLVRRAAPGPALVHAQCRAWRHLPRRPAADQDLLLHHFVKRIMTTRTIYIVDDNVEFLESTRFWLSGAGFDVRTFGDPLAAVDALAQRPPSEAACLMLDVRMPQLSGLDLHDALIERGAELP